MVYSRPIPGGGGVMVQSLSRAEVLQPQGLEAGGRCPNGNVITLAEVQQLSDGPDPTSSSPDHRSCTEKMSLQNNLLLMSEALKARGRREIKLPGALAGYCDHSCSRSPRAPLHQSKGHCCYRQGENTRGQWAGQSWLGSSAAFEQNESGFCWSVLTEPADQELS